MNQYLYLRSTYLRKVFKIGSTVNIRNRLGTIKTEMPDFDNISHYVHIFKILESKYTCYELDHIISELSRINKYFLCKYMGTGGNEFYHINKLNASITNIEYLLKSTDTEFISKRLNINKLFINDINHDTLNNTNKDKVSNVIGNIDIDSINKNYNEYINNTIKTL